MSWKQASIKSLPAQIPKSEYGLAFGSLSGGEQTRVVLASHCTAGFAPAR